VIGRARLGALLVAVLLVTAAPVARASAPLGLGFFDGVFLGADAQTWIGRAAAANANVIRIEIGWVAPNTPRKPAGFDAENPADPNYSFAAADAAVTDAAADGMRVVLDFTGAPLWAEGRGMPRRALPGTWRPNPADIRQYAIALARRYSGSFPDPANPLVMLPKVYAFQLWNEPNLPNYLEPQWIGARAVAPSLYRGMLNAFYAGIKSVDPHALVVTAGTAPFGDPGPGGRIMPALFWRDVLCVNEVGTTLNRAPVRFRRGRCPNPAHFDVLAHHPYSVGAPSTEALNADDVSIPDIGKLTQVLRFAEHAGTALPRIHHQIWVTEVGYNTDPPNPNGVPINTAARWLEQTLELLWSQGVSLITWNTIADQPPVPSYSETSQAGVYFVDGQPKTPLLEAFSFPLVATRAGASTLSVWGRSPAQGRVLVEREVGGVWRTFASKNVNIGDTFLTHLVDTGPVTLRAQIGAYSSPVWIQR
jgi:hypothetical protein